MIWPLPPSLIDLSLVIDFNVDVLSQLSKSITKLKADLSLETGQWQALLPHIKNWSSEGFAAAVREVYAPHLLPKNFIVVVVSRPGAIDNQLDHLPNLTATSEWPSNSRLLDEHNALKRITSIEIPYMKSFTCRVDQLPPSLETLNLEDARVKWVDPATNARAAAEAHHSLPKTLRRLTLSAVRIPDEEPGLPRMQDTAAETKRYRTYPRLHSAPLLETLHLYVTSDSADQHYPQLLETLPEFITDLSVRFKWIC